MLRILHDVPTTVLQWGPVMDENPAFPGGRTLLGLVIAGLGAVVTVLGVLWLSGPASDRDAAYQAGEDQDTARVSPGATTTFGAILLAAGLFLLFSG